MHYTVWVKFSIFTPAHKPEKLKRAYESILKQTYDDFEWIILLNNGATLDGADFDDRVKIYNIKDLSGAEDNGYIGNYKRICCSLATGDVLVELDYDDTLEPNCLSILKDHFTDDDVDFVYSSCYEYKNGKCVAPFSPEWGWQYEEQPDGRIVTKAFEPTPLNFGYIWYAPNHVRSWRRSFYEKIGGHNPKLDVCDDHDLCCRTYIEGNVVMEPRPLYSYYTADGENTCYGDKNKQIQIMTRNIHDQYIESLVLKWCELNNLPAYDLCCSKFKREGFIGVDVNDYDGVDVVADLDKAPWPFKDNSVGVFRMQDALEHLSNPIQTMKELWRCLSPKGWVLIDVPSTDGRGAFQDPTHVSFWNSNSFWYYTKKTQAQYIDTPVKFQLNRILDYYPSDFHKLHKIVYTKAHLVKLHNDLWVPPGGREI